MSARRPAAHGAESEASISLKVGGDYLSVRAIDENAFRVRLAGNARPAASSLILTGEVPPPMSRLVEGPTTIGLETSAGRVLVDRATGGVMLEDSRGRRLLEERVELRTLKRGRVQYRAASGFAGPDGERLFGAGQFQDGRLDIRDLPRRLTQVNSQIALPFILSSRGYALLWHNYGLTELNPADEAVKLVRGAERAADETVEVTSASGSVRENRATGDFTGSFTVPASGRFAFMLDVGSKMARLWKVAIDGVEAVDYHNFWLPPTTSWHMELEAGRHTVTVTAEWNDRPKLFFRPSSPYLVFRSPVAEALDYVLFLGGADEIIASVRRLTGEVPLLPRWAYGYIHCRERYHNQAELLENAKSFRAKGIPLDVIVQDWQYWGRLGWNAMAFDHADYPDPAGMIRELHEQRIRLMLSVWSKIDPRSEVGREFAEKGHYIEGSDWVDFFDPAAAGRFWDSLSERLLPLGIDAWWLDATEPENDDLDGRVTKAGPGARVRNVYPLFVTRTVYEGLRKQAPQRRVFILTRSAFPGVQRYGTAAWSGDVGSDWQALRRQITAGLGFVLSGLPYWTTDGGGFFRPGPEQYSDESYRELLLRWFQYAVFCPLLRVHGYQTDTEPWRYGSLVESGIRSSLQLRYRLLPYIYSQAARITFAGSTLMRPLVMDFPEDEKALACTDEFMFGPSFLVSPVTRPGATTRAVYLPKADGGWYDFWSGSRLDGGSEIEAPAPIERLPLHVPAGSIIPFGPGGEHAEAALGGSLILCVYPGRNGRLTLYEDGGEDYAYEAGEYAMIPVTYIDRDRSLEIGARQGSYPGMRANRKLRIVKVAPGRGGLPRAEWAHAIIDYSGEAMIVDLSGD